MNWQQERGWLDISPSLTRKCYIFTLVVFPKLYRILNTWVQVGSWNFFSKWMKKTWWQEGKIYSKVKKIHPQRKHLYYPDNCKQKWLPEKMQIFQRFGDKIRKIKLLLLFNSFFFYVLLKEQDPWILKPEIIKVIFKKESQTFNCKSNSPSFIQMIKWHLGIQAEIIH